MNDSHKINHWWEFEKKSHSCLNEVYFLSFKRMTWYQFNCCDNVLHYHYSEASQLPGTHLKTMCQLPIVAGHQIMRDFLELIWGDVRRIVSRIMTAPARKWHDAGLPHFIYSGKDARNLKLNIQLWQGRSTSLVTTVIQSTNIYRVRLYSQLIEPSQELEKN